MKKYHIGFTTKTARDAAEVRDFENLGKSDDRIFEDPSLLGLCEVAQDRAERQQQRARKQREAASCEDARAANVNDADLLAAIRDPLEVWPKPMTDRVKRKLRKRKLNYLFRVFAADH